MNYAKHQDSPIRNGFNWLVGHFTGRTKALWLYRRGMAKAKKRDHRGAIEDYTKTVDITATPADVRAMVLYNRALTYLTIGEDQKGLDDLEAVLAMDKAPMHVKTEARRRLLRKKPRPA